MGISSLSERVRKSSLKKPTSLVMAAGGAALMFLAAEACARRMDISTKVDGKLCAGFSDVLVSDADCEAISAVTDSGIMKGEPDGSFGKEVLVKRGEITKSLLEAAGLYDKNQDYCRGFDPFPDLKLAECEDLSLCNAVCRAKMLGVLRGHGQGSPYQGKVRIADPTNRAEFSTINYRIMGEPPVDLKNNYEDVQTGVWYEKPASFAKKNQIFPGKTLEPPKFVTKAEAARIIHRTYPIKKPK